MVLRQGDGKTFTLRGTYVLKDITSGHLSFMSSNTFLIDQHHISSVSLYRSWSADNPFCGLIQVIKNCLVSIETHYVSLFSFRKRVMWSILSGNDFFLLCMANWYNNAFTVKVKFFPSLFPRINYISMYLFSPIISTL